MYRRSAAAIFHQQSGAGLIEVLIAIIITAFALIGLAGLQMTALRYQKVAQQRALATAYSGNLAERVRANIGGALDGYYQPALQKYPAATDHAPEAPVCGISAACTHAEIAAIDIHEWRAALGRAMAGGWGEISGSVKNGFVVRVYFREPGNQDGMQPHVDDGALSKTNCRKAALNAATDKDVRCFSTVFVP